MLARILLFSSALALAALPLPAKAEAGSSAFLTLKYREIGPAISGGRSTAVAGSNRDSRLYFAGGAGGGVFKTTDGGASWSAIFDREPVAPIGAIAISPQDDRDVWVGTGESNPRNDVESGDGVYHSVDGGRSWQHLGLERSAHIASITIDPRNRRFVAIGVLGRVSADDPDRGVYVTHDGGAHWTRTLYVGPASGVSSLVRVPDRPATLFAGVWQFRRTPWRLDSGGPLGGIYRSDDNGATWRKLIGSGLPSGFTGRIGLAAGTHGRIYAIIQSRQGELWRSDDGGATWNEDAAQLVSRRAAILLQQHFRRPGEFKSTHQRRAHSFDEHRRRPLFSRDRDQRRLGLPCDLVVSRRQAHRRRMRRRRHRLVRRRCALLAAVRSALRPAVSRGAWAVGNKLSRLHRLAGRQLMVRSVGTTQWNRCHEPGLVSGGPR